MKSLYIICIAMCTYFVGSSQTFQKFSHRGGKGLMPENTIIAMQNAMDHSTNLEMDIYLSKDNQVFVYHDYTINPVLTTNADGSFVTKEQSEKKKIHEYTYAELRSFDVGSRSNPAFLRKKNVKAHIPLLTELIDSVEIYAKVGELEKALYSIEIKVPKGKLPESYKKRLVDATIKIISDKNIQDRVIIQSFDVEVLEYLNEKYPQTRLAYLVYIGKGDYLANFKRLSFTPSAYSPFYKEVTQAMIDYCHKNNMKVIVWTVDDRKEIERLKNMGVDQVISDYPDYF